MSKVIETAVAALNEKMGDNGFDGVAKFVMEGAGTIIVDDAGARADDGGADVTLTAPTDVFEQILSGDLDPTTAFMSGKLSIDGDMGAAMRLGSLLS